MNETTARAEGTVAALNLRAMAREVLAAYDARPRSHDPALDGNPSALKATTLLHAWAVLTGTTRDPDEALELARSVTYHDGPAALLTGEDHRDGIQYLVTVWPEGEVTAAIRPDAFSTWGPPADLTPAP